MEIFLVKSVACFKAKVDSSLACFFGFAQWILRFTSGATPADVLTMAAEPFWSQYLNEPCRRSFSDAFMAVVMSFQIPFKLFLKCSKLIEESSYKSKNFNVFVDH